jgi:YVTN family beta-propeller protein
MSRLLLAALALSAALSAQTVAVINRGENTISLIDPAGATVKLPTGEGPHEALSCGGRILVSNYGNQTPGSTFFVYDPAARKQVGTVDVAPLARPHGMVCAGDAVWFTAETNMAIGRIRLADLKLDQIVGTGQKAGHMIARVPSTGAMYVANITANVVSRFANGTITTAAAGQSPEGIDVSPDGATVWAANRGDSTISVIDTASMKSVETIPTAKFVFRVRFTPDGKRVLATEPESNAVRVFDAASRKLIQSIPVDGLPVSVAITADGKRAYVVGAGAAKVYEIDLEKLAVARTFATGAGPDGVAVM